MSIQALKAAGNVALEPGAPQTAVCAELRARMRDHILAALNRHGGALQTPEALADVGLTVGAAAKALATAAWPLLITTQPYEECEAQLLETMRQACAIAHFEWTEMRKAAADA